MELMEFVRVLHKILSSSDWSGLSGVIAIISLVFAIMALNRSRQLPPYEITRKQQWNQRIKKIALLSHFTFSRTQIKQPTSKIIKLRRRSPRYLIITAIGLFALLQGAIVWNIQLDHQVTSLQEQFTKASIELATASALRPVTYTIKGNGQSEWARGQLTYLPDEQLTTLSITGLSHLQQNEVYQGWLIHGKTPVSIGMLTVQNGIASVTFPGAISGYEIAAVSQEPGPSLSKNAPAGPVIATGDLLHPTVSLYIF